ncbi:uncharacterized protein LOC119740792 [Patiria miniata]|uniref:Myb-like domain-containing protein n=1 Tax=Patiria miniata TaxID=46514 RepID=A0A914B7I9_PATMI|nr:uncharacterized protein LOC119740792 [Patiria miniata]
MEARAAKRKPNWTDTEQIIMLDAYAKYKEVLACHVISCHEKNKCWFEITKQLNLRNSSVQRSIEEVKRKWHNLLGQGRRDFYDWKQACQNPNMVPGPSPMPAISRRVLELHGGFILEEWKERLEPGSAQTASHQDEEEFIYVEASSPDMSEDQGTYECLDSPDIAEPEIKALASDPVKRECPSPQVLVMSDSSEASAHQTSAALSATSPISTAFHTSTTSNLHISTPPYPTQPPNPASLTFNTVQSTQITDAQTNGSRNQANSVSPLLNQTPQNPSPRHITPPTLVSMATISNISSSVGPTRQPPSLFGPTTNPQSSYLSSLFSPTTNPQSSYPSSLFSPTTNPQPSEPPRKKVRVSESGVSERGAGLHVEREAELRLDILQLEKDKLWLETEKLRLEIDILRKKKQQMNSNY